MGPLMRRAGRSKHHTPRPYEVLIAVFCVMASAHRGLAATDKGVLKGAPSAALFQADEDPQGDKDSFGSLPEREKKRWSYVEDIGVEAKMRSLATLETTVSVHLKLVGFDGEGNLGAKIHEVDLQKFLDALKTDPRLAVIHGESHELGFGTKQLFHLSKADRALSHDIDAAIEQAVNKGQVGGSAAVAVPHTAVDQVVEADFAKGQGFYTVYLLNPKRQSLPYAYTYGDAKDCPGTLFAGTERYVWVDLTAGPVSYGPLEHGEGLVTNTTFVRVASFAGDQLRGAFLAHLVSLLASATRFLLAPALFHHPVPFAHSTEVRLVHLKGSQEDTQEEGIQLAAIEAQLGGKAPLVLPRQELTFQASNLFLAHCAFCAAAYSRALRSYPGPALQADGRLAIHQYLDSDELHHLLSEFWPEIKSAAGVQEPPFLQEGGAPSGRIIPIFVLDLDTEEPILLDRLHQAVAYDDMVIAVRTRTPSHPLKYQCGGEVVTTDLREVTRPVLAALLQTGWGVTPTYMTWSPLHNRTLEDYRWAVGPSPFGPFSRHSSLAFPQRDAALRNILLSMLNETLSDALHTLAAIKGYGGEAVILRTKKQRGEFTQRWNVFKHKLRQACTTISLLDYPHGLYYLRSARHDAKAMLDLARASAAEIHTTFSCFKDPPTDWLWYASIAALGFGIGSLWMNRERILRVKHKRF